MSNDNLRAAITAALRRRGTIDDLDASPSLTLLGSRTSTASVVIYGADGAVVDVVARASDDAKALRGVAFAVGLREDASDPAEEVERYRTIAGNLLARIHRDGGHHADAIGWERAADEADVIVARLYVERDEALAAVREYLAALDALTVALADDSDAGDAVAMLARMHVARTRRDEALSRLRALVSS